MRIPVLLGLLGVAGCGEVASLPDAAPEAPPPYLGVWKVTSGDLWNTAFGAPTYIQFDADGGGALRSHFPSNVLGCGLEFLHARPMDGFVLVDIAGQRLYHYEVATDGKLLLSDQSGHMLTLEHATEIPASEACGELQISQTVADIHLQLGGFSGLGVKSPTELWVVNNSNQLVSINPTTGEATPAPTPPGSYAQIQAFEGNAFWAHCACGGSPEIALRTADAQGTQIDLVDTTAFGNAKVTIRAAAVDGTTLWLGGYGNNSFQLLEVTRTGPTTHSLGKTFPFSNVQALAAADGNLWAIARGTGSALVRIDKTTNLAAATYALPGDIDWRAMGAGGGGLWLLGNESDGDVHLIRVTPQ